MCSLPQSTASERLPFSGATPALMLAPMQSVTNRAVRAQFAQWARPDVLFTEFLRVRPSSSGDPFTRQDRRELKGEEHGVPLVVQLIGGELRTLREAAEEAARAGALHLNLNLGCPYGRMTAGSGGRLLRRPEQLAEILAEVRAVFRGSFSVKVRSGYDDPEQIFSLLPLFEDAKVDFLVLHPRTVEQQFEGMADHGVTARVVGRTRLPVIANGDIRTAKGGLEILERTGAAGLMLGRGAFSDPDLFLRLRGGAPADPAPADRTRALGRFLGELLTRYEGVFCGEVQVLDKIKAIVGFIEGEGLAKTVKRLKRAKSADAFRQALGEWA